MGSKINDYVQKWICGKGEGEGLGFYIIDNPLGKRGPPRFACEAGWKNIPILRVRKRIGVGRFLLNMQGAHSVTLWFPFPPERFVCGSLCSSIGSTWKWLEFDKMGTQTTITRLRKERKGKGREGKGSTDPRCSIVSVLSAVWNCTENFSEHSLSPLPPSTLSNWKLFSTPKRMIP